MFCPGCGAEERNKGQFCRSCGIELQALRTMVERPDSITASAISAREEIGLAIADRIKELSTGKDIKVVAEDVLPQIEKFLESPEERRLRHFRNGVITSAVGMAVALFSAIMSTLANNKDEKALGLLGVSCGFVVLLIGLGIITNARWFTVIRKEIGHPKRHTNQLESSEAPAKGELQSSFSSITEGTTRQLK